MKAEIESRNNDEIRANTDPIAVTAGRRKPIILVFSDFYLPGYKSGGGMRTLVNVVERFGDDYDFRIVTRDHDGKADRTPYADVEYGSWQAFGSALVRHLSRDEIRIATVRKIFDEVRPDLVFCNSYFSTLTIFVLLLRRFGSVNVPLVIAPQGEISDGALGLKTIKKKAFLAISRLLGLYKDIVWRASSPIEAAEIERAKGSGGMVIVAPDLSSKIAAEFHDLARPPKAAGEVKLVYLSRVHPKKNLAYLLEVLRSVAGRVKLDMIGPVDSTEYFEVCTQLMKALPPNINVEIVGEIEHRQVPEMLSKYHFFVLPTLSENFGHVFVEAMSAGLPLIISDRTPWLELESKGIGWDIPLERQERWIDVIEKCVKMTSEELAEMSGTVRKFAGDWVNDEEIERMNRRVFEVALSPKDV